METPSPESLASLAGIVLVVTILMEAGIKRPRLLSPDQLDRFGALIAIALGIVTSLGIAALLGTAGDGRSILLAVSTGLFGGSSAAGLYNGWRQTERAMG